VEGVAFKDASYDLVHVGDLLDARYPAAMIFFKQGNIDGFCVGGPKYTTPEIEESINAFIAEPDEEVAKEMALAIEQKFKDECWYSNTYAEMHAALTAPDIKGYSTIERGYLDCTNFYK
jgi:peptide/nickel transport system substrate-binding protein